MKSIALLGTGLMGAPMAARILGAGYAVTVWNRSADKTASLVAKGAKAAKTPAEAATGADMVITMLADGPTVTEVLIESGVADSLKPGALVVDMSSIPPATAKDHAAKLTAMGLLYLDAPVSGGTKGAELGTLAIMAGGTQEAFDKAKPVLESMGRPTLIGPNGAGQVSKLANQVIVAVTISAVAEALLLASAGGADPAKVREALSGGFADSMILKQHGQRMLDRAWVPGGLTKMQIKDLRTILATADDVGLELPVAKRVAAMFEDAAEHGFGNCDHSALLLELERINPGKRVGTKPDQMPS